MKRFLTLCACAGILVAATPGFSTTSTKRPDDTFTLAVFSGRAGIYLPFDESLTDLDNSWFSAGIDVEFPTGLMHGARTVVSLDWITHNSGSRDNAFPITLNQRWYTATNGSGQRTYFQIGLGLAVVDFTPSDTLFVGRAGFGWEWNDNLFFEANIIVSGDDSNNNNITGVGGFLGIRF